MAWAVERSAQAQLPEPAIILNAGTSDKRPTVKDATGLGPLSAELLQALATPDPAVGGVPAHNIRGSAGLLGDVAAKFGALFGRFLGPSKSADPTELASRTNALEDRAFEVLEVLTPKRIGEAEAAFDGWFGDVESRSQKGERLDTLEHLTVLHVLKEKLFEGQDALAPYVPRMQAVLQSSDEKLIGKKRPLDRIMGDRLPRWFLANQSSDAKKIHAAIFASKNHSLTSTVGDFAKSYIPGRSDPIVAAGILAALFTGAGVHVLAGAVHGYLLATLVEHTIHEKIGHANPRSLEKLEEILSRFGPIGRAIHDQIKETAFSHGTIHHGSYAGSYVDRFGPRDPELPDAERDRMRGKRKAAIDAQAASRGPSAAADIFKSDYGRKLAHAIKSALVMAPAAAIVTLFTTVIANQLGADLGALFMAASVATSLIFIPASNSLHPYLHMTKEEAFEKAGPLMRRFLESGYVSHIAQSHYLHHRVPGVNHNLIAGADYALGYKPTPVEAIVALRKMKTFY